MSKKKKEQLKSMNSCPECCNTKIISDKHQAYCSKCGLIIYDAYPYTAGKKFKTNF